MKNFWRNFFTVLKRLSFIVAGSVLTGVGLNVFISPLNMAPSGISGVASLIHTVSNGVLPIGVMILLLNIPLFIAGFLILGKKFVFGSLAGTVIYSVAIDIIEQLMPFINRYYDVTKTDGDRLLFAIVGGVLTGVGYGLIFRGGATTGGTDILARLLQNKVKWLSIGQLVLFLDALLLVFVAITYNSLSAAFYSAIIAFVSSKVIDVVEAGINYAKHLYIITNKPEEISRDIIEKLGRGVTKLNGTGMYTGNNVSVLLCVVYNKQLGAIRKIIDTHDKNAFISIINAREAKLYADSSELENTDLPIQLKKQEKKEKKKRKK